MFLLGKKLVLTTVEIYYEMDGREISLEESVIPEEKDTLEAIRDCLLHVLRECERCRHRESIEIWVRGDYMDYFFEALFPSSKSTTTPRGGGLLGASKRGQILADGSLRAAHSLPGILHIF